MASFVRWKSIVTSGMRRVASEALHRVPTSLWRELYPKTELGFCYHMVSDARPPHLRHYPILSPAEFQADLAYLRRHFNFTSYEQLVQRRGAAVVRDNSVILTFDDGFAECATIVAPILRRHDVNCVFFVITDLIDNRMPFRETEASLCIEAICRLPIEHVEAIVRDLRLDSRLRPPPERTAFSSLRLPLDIAGLDGQPHRRLRPLLHWLLTVGKDDMGLLRQLSDRLGIDAQDYVLKARPYLTTRQILQLRADGFTIGAHSCGHHLLQDMTRADAELQIIESCRIVRDITGQASVPFAFPYFGGGLDRIWLARLRHQNDFIGLFFDTDGLREDESFVVQRVFGERFSHDRTLDAILRRAWSRRPAWRGRD
jgi:peptidoglycan/xylan/chitin deacetylase (PgdA/CDA1 family)